MSVLSSVDGSACLDVEGCSVSRLFWMYEDFVWGWGLSVVRGACCEEYLLGSVVG